MSDFESMSYAEMISNARASLDFGTKELYEEQESFSYDEIVEDLENLEILFPDENIENIEFFNENNFDIDNDIFDFDYEAHFLSSDDEDEDYEF